MDPGSANEALTLIARVVALGKRATYVQYEEALQTAREVILQQKELNLVSSYPFSEHPVQSFWRFA